MRSFPHPQLPGSAPALHRRSGFSLVEVIMALAITGVVAAMVAAQMVESATLSLRVARTLEHSRNAREMIDRLSVDVRAAQIMRLYPAFDNRSFVARDGESGNYLVLHTVNSTGTITRTIGYYVTTVPQRPGWTVFRHDSADGDSEPGALPATTDFGTHRQIKRAVQLPDSNRLFRCVRDRGVAIYGEFGTADQVGTGRTEFIRYSVFTRS